MPVPIVTFGIVIMRASLRPINKFFVSQFKNAKQHPAGFKFFSSLGHGTYMVEQFMKSAEELKKEAKECKDTGTLPDQVAFNMGIDWFTEIFFFYGTLCLVCWWEFNKFVES